MASLVGKRIRPCRVRDVPLEQVTKYEREIGPDDVKGPTIRDRKTGVLTRWADGYDTDQVSNDIGTVVVGPMGIA
jgi:hypothetical protein